MSSDLSQRSALAGDQLKLDTLTEHRQRQRLLRPDVDNDAMIGPGVVGQIPIGSNVAHAGTMEADPATIPI